MSDSDEKAALLRKDRLSSAGSRLTYHATSDIVDAEGDDDIDIRLEENEAGELTYHCHTHAHRPPIDSRARRVLILASILCLAFMVAEIVGGLLADSLAIITDAAHLLTDFAGFMVSLFALFVSSRRATPRMSFGYYRAEVLGAFFSVLLIWVITGVLVYAAIQRVVNQNYDIDALVMLITASLGVLVNLVMGALLHWGGGGHGHSHGGGHGHSHGQRNINVRAAFIHVLGDFVQSVGVLLAAALIYFRPDLKVVDPICTFMFSILVLITTIAIMRDALHVLMEGIPRGIDFAKVTASLQQVDGVRMVHDLRIWALTMDKVALSVHLAVDGDSDAQTVLRRATDMLREEFGVHECTIQIEHYSLSMADCIKCEPPI